MRYRLLFGLVASGLVATLVVSGGVLWVLRETVRERFVERIRAETDLLAELALELGSGDLQEQAVRLARRLDMRVSLISADGVVLGDSARDRRSLARMDNHLDRPEIVAASLAGYGEAARTSASTNVRYFYSARTVHHDGPVRFVRLALPAWRVGEVQSRYGWFVIATVSGSMMLLTGLAYVLVRRLSRPLERLTDAVEQVAEGNLGGDIPLSGGYETVRLATATRRMVAALLGRIAELEEEHRVLSSVVSGMKEGLLLIGPDRRIRLANTAMRQILELPFEPEGHMLAEAVRHPAVIQDVEAALRGEVSSDESILEMPGTGRSFELRVTALEGAQSTRGVLVLLFDITQLQTLERIRREFVSNVSHELRTPMTAIKASAETLLDEIADDRGTGRFVSIISRNADHMEELIDDLTDLSRIETGAIALELSPIDAAEVARGVAERLQPVAAEREVTVRVELDAPFVLRADRRRLEQMLTNLIDNAVKFNRPGGEVVLRGHEEPGRRVLTVEDTGIGIPADARDRVFHRFYQVDRGRSGEGRGTGLGLAIVKHLMRLHGGRVALDSELGRGSRFCLEFPAPP